MHKIGITIMKVLKAVSAILLLGFILFMIGLLFVIAYLKFGNGSDNGSILRSWFVKYPLLVQITRLDQPGDQKYLYLKSNEPVVDVYVYYVEGEEPNKNLKVWLDEMIESTIGKDVNYQMTLLNYQNESEYDEAQLIGIRRSFYRFSWNKPVLYIIYLTKRAEDPSNAGITQNKDTIYIFKDVLVELNENKSVQERLERSTIYHEWGHILGLEHLTRDDCIMSAQVDVLEGRYPKGMEIPIEYCPETISKLNRI